MKKMILATMLFSVSMLAQAAPIGNSGPANANPKTMPNAAPVASRPSVHTMEHKMSHQGESSHHKRHHRHHRHHRHGKHVKTGNHHHHKAGHAFKTGIHHHRHHGKFHKTGFHKHKHHRHHPHHPVNESAHK